MKVLSRKEELLLLAVWKLQDNAYGVTIREYIEQKTGIKWLFGAIYSPLGRLVKQGLVEAYEGPPLPEPGGRRRTLFRLTPHGREALIFVREMSSALWNDIPPLRRGNGD
jgi:DNA-binding PadR family transcriptional regulator